MTLNHIDIILRRAIETARQDSRGRWWQLEAGRDVLVRSCATAADYECAMRRLKEVLDQDLEAPC